MHVNGEKIDMQSEMPISLGEFLRKHGYDAQRVAAEKNGEIVPKKDYESVTLADGDKLEIVHFVGGG